MHLFYFFPLIINTNKTQGRNGLETDLQYKVLDIRCQHAVFVLPTSRNLQFALAFDKKSTSKLRNI